MITSKQWWRLKKMHAVVHLLGCIFYVHRFTALAKLLKPFQWNEQQQAAFWKVKNVLSWPPWSHLLRDDLWLFWLLLTNLWCTGSTGGLKRLSTPFIIWPGLFEELRRINLLFKRHCLTLSLTLKALLLFASSLSESGHEAPHYEVSVPKPGSVILTVTVKDLKDFIIINNELYFWGSDVILRALFMAEGEFWFIHGLSCGDKDINLYGVYKGKILLA